MQFINLTPHAVSIRMQDGSMLNVPASGDVARVSETRKVVILMRES